MKIELPEEHQGQINKIETPVSVKSVIEEMPSENERLADLKFDKMMSE